jgi:WD40 repeat protein
MDLPSEIFAISLHPTRPVLAAALLSGHVTCHDSILPLTSSATSKWQAKRHKGSARDVVFSPDGTRLVSVGKNGVVKLSDSETGKLISKDDEAHVYLNT